ncbi:hypothetical protein AAFF_G00055080 [Aldrovandia affinis]|uniref:Uncharacterized protein n=1 Tax=Aldrovandia affinis TaxID=143900 RepID=A0AAD7WET9_9TELE|nr:hypothetical protein AAFF_G00055080 [Aldrovandia affinis]
MRRTASKRGCLGGLCGLHYFAARSSPTCARLQDCLDSNPKYTATHRRRLPIVGAHPDRMPPTAYPSEAAERHFNPLLMPQAPARHRL